MDSSAPTEIPAFTSTTELEPNPFEYLGIGRGFFIHLTPIERRKLLKTALQVYQAKNGTKNAIENEIAPNQIEATTSQELVLYHAPQDNSASVPEESAPLPQPINGQELVNPSQPATVLPQEQVCLPQPNNLPPGPQAPAPPSQPPNGLPPQELQQGSSQYHNMPPPPRPQKSEKKQLYKPRNPKKGEVLFEFTGYVTPGPDLYAYTSAYPQTPQVTMQPGVSSTQQLYNQGPWPLPPQSPQPLPIQYPDLQASQPVQGFNTLPSLEQVHRQSTNGRTT
ncbi:hypothetical protein TWF281_008976 [Arthrobotrys megalospora]